MPEQYKPEPKIFLAGDHNCPGGVWAIDIDRWNWMIYNGCAPYVLSQEEAQKLLTEGGMGVDFGEEDNRWNYHSYNPLSEQSKKELEEDKSEEPEYWGDVYMNLLEGLREKGWR